MKKLLINFINYEAGLLSLAFPLPKADLNGLNFFHKTKNQYSLGHHCIIDQQVNSANQWINSNVLMMFPNCDLGQMQPLRG